MQLQGTPALGLGYPLELQFRGLRPLRAEGADTLRATGFVRRIDALGRIVLPVELGTSLGIKEKSVADAQIDPDTLESNL